MYVAVWKMCLLPNLLLPPGLDVLSGLTFVGPVAVESVLLFFTFILFCKLLFSSPFDPSVYIPVLNTAGHCAFRSC
jgi:hypothetical protein